MAQGSVVSLLDEGIDEYADEEVKMPFFSNGIAVAKCYEHFKKPILIASSHCGKLMIHTINNDVPVVITPIQLRITPPPFPHPVKFETKEIPEKTIFSSKTSDTPFNISVSKPIENPISLNTNNASGTKTTDNPFSLNIDKISLNISKYTKYHMLYHIIQF